MTVPPNIPDRYKILKELGSGGMGTVYKVHDTLLNTVVALKVLNVSGNADTDKILRFNKEARACALLRHKNIIGVLDFGYHENVTPYMVMEYAEGETLKKRVGKLSIEESFIIFEQVASALAHAHDQNIIHRDLKSDNILLTKGADGETIAKLFDFGIAKISEDDNVLRLTATNAIIGTPTTMSPEQARGQRADARSDLYSFGCLMFQTLTGRLPFTAKDVFGLLEMQMTLEPPKVGSIVKELSDSALEAIVNRCLRKNPDERFQSATEILESLSTSTIQQEPIEDSSVNSQIKPADTVNNSAKTIALPIGIILVSGIGILAISAPVFNQYMQSTKTETIEKTSAKKKHAPKRSIPKPPIDWLSGVEKDDKRVLYLARIEHISESDIPQIPKDKGISTLDISNLEENPLTEKGFEYVSKLDFIQNIQMIDFKPITNSNIKWLARMKDLQYLRATNSTFEDVSALTQLKQLTGVELSDMTAEQVQSLNKDGTSKLQHLSLPNVNFDMKMVKAICSFKNLEVLMLESASYREVSAIAELRTIPTLKRLDISDWRQLTDEEAHVISQIKQMEILDTRRNGLTDEHVKQFANLTGLHKVYLDANPKLSRKAISYLQTLPSLKTVSMRLCPKVYDFSVSEQKKFNAHRRQECEFVVTNVSSATLNFEKVLNDED